MLKTLTEEHMSLANRHLANWEKGNKTDIAYFEEIRLIQVTEDESYFWKGEQELVNRHDWMALTIGIFLLAFIAKSTKEVLKGKNRSDKYD